MTLAIYCAGGLGKETLELAKSVNRWDGFLFVDDVTDATEYQGMPVRRFESLSDWGNDLEFVIANGEPAVRKALYEKVKAEGYSLATLISPWTTVFPGATVGEGCILWDCGISADVMVGVNTLINSRVIVGHDAVIGSHNVISPNCFLGGHAQLGERVFMGPGAMAKDRVHIGEGSIISLGAVILRNVRPNTVMVGNPARKIGKNETGRVFEMFE